MSRILQVFRILQFGELQSRITESHRMIEVGRDLWRSSGPTSCSSRATESRLLRTMSRWLLNISENGDSMTSLDNLFDDPYSQKVLPYA